MANKDEIKNRLDILSVADSMGLQTRKNGGYTWITCPCHRNFVGKDDNSPTNCIVNKDNTYHCFACNHSGDIFDMIMQYKNVSFKEAMEEAAEMAGISLDTVNTSTQKPVFFTASDFELLGLTNDKNRHCNVVGCTPIKSSSNVSKYKSSLFQKEDNYLLEDDDNSFSLYQLEKEDPETFYRMVYGKAEEQRKKIKDIASDLKEYKGEHILNIIDILKKKYVRLGHIKDKCLLELQFIK